MLRWIWKTEKTSQGETDATNVQSNPHTKPGIISKISNFVAGTSHLLVAVVIISATVVLLGIITMVSVCMATGRGPICIASKETADNSKQLEAIALTTWSSWTQCSVTCGKGSQIRYKLTYDGNATEHQNQSCKLESCTTYGNWQPWSAWSSCSATCGPGSATRTRHRQCQANLPPGSCIQPTVATETQRNECNIGDCPRVNGGWSPWNPWSTCLVSCGWGYRARNRLCNNPPPSGGGSGCANLSAGYEKCLGGVCPVDGQWGPWAPCPPALGGPNCNTNPRGECAAGIKMHCRSCDDPEPEFGGTPCITGLASVRRDCWNIDACDNSIVQPPMNFTIVGFLKSNDLLIKWRRAPFGLAASSFFITWAVAGTNSKGDAVVPAVPPSQQDILGESYEYWLRNLVRNSVLDVSIATRSTATGMPKVSASLRQSFQVSRVDGGWGAWSSYGDCSPTMDCNIPGRRSRTRSCDSPKPTNGGLPCVGSSVETSRCFHQC